MIHGCGYGGNRSIKRYIHHRLIANKFYKFAQRCERPDIIISFIPCHRLAYMATKYAKNNSVPIIVDIRDKWPDIFITSKNKIFEIIANIILFSEQKCTKYAMRNASTLAAVSETYLNWALHKIDRARNKMDRVYYLGYANSDINSGGKLYKDENISDELRQLIDGNSSKKLIVFVGTFGFSYDLITMVDVGARFHEQRQTDVVFVLAGTGENYDKVNNSIRSPNVLLTGWINHDEIKYVLSKSYAGLMPYHDYAPQSLPNKFFEYAVNNLPIISSLKGEIAEIITENQIGINYKANDKQDLYNAIQYLVENESLHDKMVNENLAAFRNTCNANLIYEEYATYIEEIFRNNV